MPILLKQDNLYSEDGTWLKKIECPKDVQSKALQRSSERTLSCKECSHVVYDTDQMSEEDVVALLKRQPNACIKIHLRNPIFKIIS